MKPVLVDDREPPHIFKILQELNVPCLRTRLSVCDYVVGNICVERKTVKDFAQSIIDGRLFDQAFKLSSIFPLSYMVVIGYFHELFLEHGGINRKALISALIGLSLKRSPIGESGQIVTIQLESDYDFALFLERLWHKVKEGDFVRYPPVKLMKATGGMDELKVAMLSAIPGVGEKKARKLLEYFTSLAVLAKADIGDIERVEGIGRKLAKTIYDFFHSPYRVFKRVRM